MTHEKVVRYVSEYTCTEKNSSPSYGGWAGSGADEVVRLKVVKEEVGLSDDATEDPAERPHRSKSFADRSDAQESEVLVKRDLLLQSVREIELKNKFNRHLVTAGLHLFGFLRLTDRIVRRTAFFPPEPESYQFYKLDPLATRALRQPPTSSDKILAEEFGVVLKDRYNGELLTSILETNNLTITSFRLARITDGDMSTAAVLLFKAIVKADSACQEEREDMLTDLQLRPLMIFSHGNSIDLGFALVHLAQLASRLHVNLLCYDYPGYGLSRGKLTEKNIYKSFKVAYDFTRARLKIPRTMIFLYGQSLGSVPTTYGAADFTNVSCAGVILHSPLASGFRIVTPCTQNNPCRSDIMDNNSRISQCPWPIFIMHGIEDQEVPCWHSCQLDKSARDFEKASNDTQAIFRKLVAHHVAHSTVSVKDHEIRMERLWSKRVTLWLPETAGHNNIEILYRREYLKRLRNFVASNAARIKFPKQ